MEAQMIIITSKCNQNYQPTKMQVNYLNNRSMNKYKRDSQSDVRFFCWLIGFFLLKKFLITSFTDFIQQIIIYNKLKKE